MPKILVIDPSDVHLELACQEKFLRHYEVNEFLNIPSYELVNVHAIIAQRWLEDKPFLYDDVQQYSSHEVCISIARPKSINKNSIACGPLEFMVLQLKLDTKSR